MFEHIAGRKNIVADSLSRVPVVAGAHVHSAISLQDESFLLDVVRRSQHAAVSDRWFCDVAAKCSPTSTDFAL